MYTTHNAAREKAVVAADAADRAMQRHACSKSQFNFKCFSCGGMINRGDKITSIKNNILKWDNKDETHEQLNNRIQEMICWIGNRPEKNIAIVSHSSFIGMLKDKKIGDEKNELKHCHPYNIKFYYDENNNFLFLVNEKNVNKLKSFKNM